MNRARSSLLVSGLFLVLGCGARPPDRLNLVLVSLDTCRADRLACYGGDPSITPALARFAREAVVFGDCLSQSGLTAPSHMSLFTGHYVHRYGLFNNRGGIDPPYTLASVLRDAGWRTAAFTGNGSLTEKQGAASGFQLFESWVGEPAWPFTRDLEEVVPRGLAWIDRESDGDPFFLFLHAYDPHAPYWPGEETRQRFAGWYEGDFDPRRLTHPNEFARLLKRGEIGADELRYVNDLYDGELAEADRVFGELLDGLRERGLLDTSIVIFTSDHGESLGEHGWVGHSTVWEEILHVPLLVRFPGGRHAGDVGAPVQLVDLFPTLCAALGIAPPAGLQGRDLTPLVTGERAGETERMRLARVGAKKNQVALRFDDRWKLVFSEAKKEGIGGLHLYDLTSDRAESRNLARTAEGRERSADMLARYRRFREATRADDRRFASTPREGEPSPEDEATLRALGYVGGD